ncbi:helix-turn-helix domain-containing protein [Microvirga aerilata]|uniref:Helix-turn-helix domain-containing protein n=1 Tax=Microvirga aerilata TaxID=670292 RepID=A0A937D065_9HYPH|nr:helix-turn-helix domain-containing protein [Microvirga aerilata]
MNKHRSIGYRPGSHSVCSFTIKQVAERWSSSERTVRRRIKSGDLAAFRVGSLLRILESDLEAFEAKYRVR